jgi:chorismate dehydratase
MWDFEHPPRNTDLARRYSIQWMMPAQCAARLALPIDHPQAADIGLVPIAALATTPGLTIVPGCAIAATRKVRSILLVRRASQPLDAIRTVAADTSSRASLAYCQILFRRWWQPQAEFLSSPPQLDAMLQAADAALLIGDPALFALENRAAHEQRAGQPLVYHDLAQEWIALTHVPWVSAVWAVRDQSLLRSNLTLADLASDFALSRDHGLANIDSLVSEWSGKLPLPAQTVRAYLTENIHYHLDPECLAGLRLFFQLAHETGTLPAFTPA